MTRVFFVVDSQEDNEEIFETFGEAEQQYNKLGDKPRLYVALVKNAYKEPESGIWNYEDMADTFEIIKVLLPVDY